MGQSKSKPEYLSGPVSMSYYEIPETRQSIMILGDQHNGTSKNCKENGIKNSIDINKFLDKITISKNKTFDFILEQRDYFNLINKNTIEIDGIEYNTFLSKHLTNLMGNLPSVFYKYRKCFLGRNTCPEKYKNLRIHLADNRVSSNKNIYNVMNTLVFKLLYKDIYIKNAINNFDTFDKKEFFENNDLYLLLKVFLKKIPNINKDFKDIRSNKIYKQFEKIENKSILNKLTRYINVMEKENKINIIKLENNVTKLIEIFDKYKETKKVPLIINIKRLIEQIFIDYVFATLHIMDLYILGRIFRTFKLKENENDRRREMKNIIIFVGNSHKNQYDKFLQEIMKIKPIYEDQGNITEKTLRCIDIKELPETIFNNFDKTE